MSSDDPAQISIRDAFDPVGDNGLRKSDERQILAAVSLYGVDVTVDSYRMVSDRFGHMEATGTYQGRRFTVTLRAISYDVEMWDD